MKMKAFTAILLSACMLFGMAPALAQSGVTYQYYDYQKAIAAECNRYRPGGALTLDPALCGLAALLAVERNGSSRLGPTRPNGEKWSEALAEYGYDRPSYLAIAYWRTREEPSAQDIVQHWLEEDAPAESPGAFRANLLNPPHAYTGVYVHYSSSNKTYSVVQLFSDRPLEEPSDQYITAYAVTTGNVNMRKGPGTEYDKRGQFKKYRLVEVRSVDLSEKWAEISLNDSNGVYVSTDYLAIASQPATSSYPLEIVPPALEKPIAGVQNPAVKNPAVTTAWADVRSGPGAKYALLGRINKDMAVEIVNAAVNGWYEIAWLSGYQNAYVHKDNLALVVNKSDEEPAQYRIQDGQLVVCEK